MSARAAVVAAVGALDGVVESDSAFGDAVAYWVNGKEIAHFDADDVMDIRLTRGVIRDRRADLKGDPRVALRRSTSDWLEVRFASADDVAFVVGLVKAAVDARRAPPGTTAKPPPTGADLQRRRRFH